MDASLTAWGHATWWGPDESHQTGLLPPNQQPVGAPITFHCLLPRASVGVYAGIWGVNCQIKEKILLYFKAFQRSQENVLPHVLKTQLADTRSPHTGGLFFLLVIKRKYLICSWLLCWWVSGNLQDEVAVSCFTVINRCLSCYLPRPEQALTSSSSAECQFQQGRGIYLQVRHWISWSALNCLLFFSREYEVTKQYILHWTFYYNK